MAEANQPAAPPPQPAVQPEAKKWLFGQKAKEAVAQGPDLSSLPEQIAMLNARLRLSEERYSDLRRKLALIEQNLVANHKKSSSDIKALEAQIAEINRAIELVEERILAVIKEVKLTAKKEDLDVLKKYLELWNPVKFATVDAVERIVDEKLGMKKYALEEEAGEE